MNYDPAVAAQANGTWDTTFLSDRDVSSQIPINFVPHPGVYVTTACFGDGVYDDQSVQQCLSNLLSSQIRRYVIDLYWDTTNRRFSLCPVEIPSIQSNNLTTDSLTAQDVQPTLSAAILGDRQIQSSMTSFASNKTSTTPSPLPSIISVNGQSQLLQIGDYQCSTSATMSLMISVFQDYMRETSDTLQAKVSVWIMNLHVAALAGQNAGSRNLTSSQLPTTTEYVSTYLNTIDDNLYTPAALQTDRQNLNASWYRRAQESDLPINSYFRTNSLANGVLSTEDGWPDENYIQISKGKRMLIGFGTIDEDFKGYNVSVDGSQIYPPGYLSAPRPSSFNANGAMQSGCFYDPAKMSVSELNNSWAVSTINTIDPPDLGDAADNLTTCGISQLLNVTIGGQTADDNPVPYQDFGNNAIFSWAYGEPQNETQKVIDASEKFRCAILIADDDYKGHWKVTYCSERYRVACRQAHLPYTWSISGYSVPYTATEGACTGNTTFDVPRTGLENTYLYQEVLFEARNDPALNNGIWINFNSLNFEGCWVTTGANGTCPYLLDTSATQSRQILIPALAALIVLILTGLTILVKCSANARNSRLRKRGEGGWDYEGIPS